MTIRKELILYIFLVGVFLGAVAGICYILF